MSVERAKEVTEMNAKMDEEQSAEEPSKKIVKIEEQNEDEEGIRVPNWLVEVLEWITRMEMKESKLSTSCLAFKQLCWPKLHGKVEPHFVKTLLIDKESHRPGNFPDVIRQDLTGPTLPIPKVPPPEYILGFKNISILNPLDVRTLEFFKLIAPKFSKEVKFEVHSDITEDDEKLNVVRCLLDIFRNKITKLDLGVESNIQHFHRLFPGFIDPNQIKEVSISPNGPIRDVDFDILLEWLMSGRQNDGQKMMKIDRIDEVGNILERIKEAFLSDTVRRNFLVLIQLYDRNNEFIEENEKTGEILHFYSNEELNVGVGGGHCHLLMRCPKGEEDQWKKEGEKKLKGNANNETTTVALSFWEIFDCVHHDPDQNYDFPETDDE